MTADDLVATRKKVRRLTVLTVLAAVVALVAFTAVTYSTLSTGSTGTTGASGEHEPSAVPSAGSDGQPPAHDGPATAEDGVLPDNASPFDLSLPGIAKLDPDLRSAVQQAATAMAEQNGIKLHVTTGWRSKTYQRQLMDQAIRKYGSAEKAREFVASPEESHHVTGDAVDIGPTDADDWLIRKGARFGLCQTLANEMWHFELRTAPGGTCPPAQAP